MRGQQIMIRGLAGWKILTKFALYGSHKYSMTLAEIKKLVSRGESLTVEFKKTTGQLERGMETLCAFLNRDGGTALFGVTDKGELCGQQVQDSTRRNIAETLTQFHPSVAPEISYVRLPAPDKYIIAISVPGVADRRPFYFRHTPFWRIESTTSPMPEDVLEDLLMIKGGKRYVWESQPAKNMTVADIDCKLVAGTVRLGIYHNRLPESVALQPVEDILRGFHLYTDDGRLTNAAMVLFGKDLGATYPQCLLRMARFRGTDITDDFMDNRQAKGNIFNLLDAAMSFFVKHLNISGGINPATWQRDDELDIPRKALRESIINACAHRLYHRRGSSIGIAIFDDRVEVSNTGTFPIGITEDNILANDESEPMNPIIANVLYKTSYLEHWGRGIRMMHNLCVEKGLKAPLFTTNGRSVKTVFFFEKADNSVSPPFQAKRQNTEKNVPDSNVKVPDSTENVPETPPDVPEDVPDCSNGLPARHKGDNRRQIIMRMIEINPRITTDELSEILKVSRKTISRDLILLARENRLMREGGAFGGKWIIL